MYLCVALLDCWKDISGLRFPHLSYFLFISFDDVVVA